MTYNIDWNIMLIDGFIILSFFCYLMRRLFVNRTISCFGQNSTHGRIAISSVSTYYIYSPALGIINGQCRVTGYILILSDCWSECLSYKKIEVYAYNAFFILQILFGMVCRMSGEIMCSPVVSLVGFLKAFCWLTESIPSLVYYFSGVRCLFFI